MQQYWMDRSLDWTVLVLSVLFSLLFRPDRYICSEKKKKEKKHVLEELSSKCYLEALSLFNGAVKAQRNLGLDEVNFDGKWLAIDKLLSGKIYCILVGRTWEHTSFLVNSC